MRYAYIKNGDAVEQVLDYVRRGRVDESGPDAFIADFLAARSGDDVFVVCRTPTSREFSHGRLRALGVRQRQSRLGARLFRLVSAIRVGYAVLRWRPERILCGCTDELLWACTVAARILGVPMVNSRHNEHREQGGLASIGSKLNGMCMEACVGVVCHGPFTRDQVRKLGLAREKVFEFEVDLSDFGEGGDEMSLPAAVSDFVRNHGTIILFIGRVQADKGIFDLLRAFASVRERITGLGLICVGDGKDVQRLRAAVDTQGLGQDVLMPGKLEHRALPAIFRHAAVTVTPTRPEFPEGRCMVVLESLVMKVPVIAPNSGPFPYVVEHGINGLLFRPGDADSLAEQLGAGLDGVARGTFGCGLEESAAQILSQRVSFSTAVDRAFGS